MKNFNYINYAVVILKTITISYSQCSEWTNLKTTDSVFTNPAFGNTATIEIDKLNRPYTYLAAVNGGVRIYENNSKENPTLIKSIAKTNLANLDAINLFQDSIWLYVCLGNIWNTSEMAGLAIIDVSNPLSPNVLDVYTHPGLAGGSGSVIVRGNYAFLAANQNGLIILNISNKYNIKLTSSLPLSNNFPHTQIGNNSMYNARGIELNGNYAYVCYDRGGLRIVDISDLNSPVEINRYCYFPLINKVTAYNNISIHDNIAFVTIDYYGMEILDISNPNKITQIAWWHPNTWVDTTTEYNTWANSKGHANEIVYDSICKKVYVAAGKSDVVAIDVSNLSNPITCETFGSTSDVYGTWGLDYFNSKIGIAYIWSVAFPPYSNYTGFKLLQTQCSPTTNIENKFQSSNTNDWIIYPNPSSDLLHIQVISQKIESIKIFSLTGKLIQEFFTTDVSTKNLTKGLYIIYIKTDKYSYTTKLIKN